MNKIEEVEQLQKEWQVRELRAEEKGNEKLAAEAHNIAYGLNLALGIFKGPSNDVNSPGAKCYCETASEDDWPCKNCMAEYYERHR